MKLPKSVLKTFLLLILRWPYIFTAFQTTDVKRLFFCCWKEWHKENNLLEQPSYQTFHLWILIWRTVVFFSLKRNTADIVILSLVLVKVHHCGAYIFLLLFIKGLSKILQNTASLWTSTSFYGGFCQEWGNGNLRDLMVNRRSWKGSR